MIQSDSEHNISYQGKLSVASTSSSCPLPGASNQEPGYEIRPSDAYFASSELDLQAGAIPCTV